ncbi:hypothetical protein GCM10010289_00110 [Streptomyces violascens]|uniref:Uncharacterized protein n=1 Tax=Streptomyces violascens TaxID=67381 RepID=A0ABQ3QRY7_9ACTN|nr:hypothetical protein GCM10010289_00110 [Streptomyces violascens]GHI40031.1 hypothetical protein Sviol_44390 [Streptomyces violascens]
MTLIYGLHRAKGNAPLVGCTRPGERGPYGVGWSEPDREDETPQHETPVADPERGCRGTGRDRQGPSGP